MLEGGGAMISIWLLVVFVGWARSSTDVTQPHLTVEIGNTGTTRDLKRLRLSELDNDGVILELLQSVTAHRSDTGFASSNRYKRRVDVNQPPLFEIPQIIQAKMGEKISSNVIATDPDGDQVTISLTRPSSIASVTTDGLFTTNEEISGELGDLLSSLLSIEFRVDDFRGGTTYLSPEWEICACENEGVCDFERRSYSWGRLHVVSCICSEAYSGNMCQNDKDGCSAGNECFPGVECFDIPAPGTGFRCGECPDGYRGDGITCLRTCIEPVIDNGAVFGSNFEVGSQVSFRCDQGYQLVGASAIACTGNLNYDRAVPKCEDLNECQDSPCHEQATCQNVIGSFFCMCNEGFMGDGVKSCKPSLFIEYFSCEKVDSQSIQVNWQIRPKDSPSLDQLIISWSRAENFTHEVQEDLIEYYNEFDEYEEKLDSVRDKDPSSQYRALGRRKSSYIVKGLQSDTAYVIRLRLKISGGLVENPMRSCWKSTGHELLHPPQNVSLVSDDSSNVILSWHKPKTSNGLILGYIIEYIKSSPCNENECDKSSTKEVLGSRFTMMLTELSPSSSYTIRVAAVSIDGVGEFADSLVVQTGAKNLQVEDLQLADGAPTEEVSGTCLAVQFFLHIEWIDVLAQQRLLEKNLQLSIKNALNEYGLTAVRDVLVNELDDYTSVHANVWFAEMSSTTDFSKVFHDVKRKIIVASRTELWLQNLDIRSVEISECKLCDGSNTNECGNGTRCIHMHGSYFCECLPQHSPKEQSQIGKYPVSCERDSNAKIQSLKKTADIYPNYELCDKSKFDIVFVVDSSHSMTKNSFESVKRAISDFVKRFDIGPYNTQVALALYSNDMKVAFYLNENLTKKSLLIAINGLTSNGFGTKTGLALQKIQDDVLIESHGRRSKNELHVILISDGKSKDDVLESARNLQLVTPHIHVVGVGNRIHIEELDSIAGAMGEVQSYPDFMELEKNFVTKLSGTICPSYGCNDNFDYLDAIFVLDSTSSTSAEVFLRMKRFVAELISQLNIGKRYTLVGVVVVSDDVRLEFTLNRFSDEDGVVKAVQAIAHKTSTAQFNLGEAMKYIDRKLLTSKRRPGAGLSVVVMLAEEISDHEFDISLQDSTASIVVVSLAQRARTKLNEVVMPNGALFSVSLGDLATHQFQNKVKEELQKSASCTGVFPPTNIMVKVLNGSSAQVSWKRRGKMNDFKVFVYKNGMKPVEEYNSVFEVEDVSSITISDLLPGTNYAVSVQTKPGNNKFSNMVEFVTEPLPVEGDLSVVRLPDALEISFDGVVGGSSRYMVTLVNASSMNVIDSKALISLPKRNKVTFKWNMPGQYRLYVTTVNGGSYSATKEFEFEIDKLDYPRNVELVLQTNSTLGLRWGAVVEAEGYVTWLQKMSAKLVPAIETVVTDPSSRYNSLEPGQKYEFKIGSYRNDHKLFSDLSPKMVLTTAPLTISAITPIISSESIGLLFDGVTPADFYEVSLWLLRADKNKAVEEISLQAHGGPLQGEFKMKPIEGASYEIAVTTVVYNVRGLPYIFSFEIDLADPENDDLKKQAAQGNGGMDVQIRFTDTTMNIRMTPSEGDFRQYRVTVRRLNSEESQNEVAQMRGANTMIPINFRNLRPAYSYEVTIGIIGSNAQSSEIITINPPSTPANVRAQQANRDELFVTIQWNAVVGAERYVLTSYANKSEQVEVRTAETSAIVNFRNPPAEAILIYAVSNDTRGEPYIIRLQPRTEPSSTASPPVSLPPTSDLNLVATETKITASFQPDTSGLVEYFILNVASARTPNQPFITREIPVLQNLDRVTLDDPGLTPGETYVVTLSSRIRGRPGEDFNIVQKSTTLDLPDYPPVRALNVTETTSVIRLTPSHPESRYDYKFFDTVASRNVRNVGNRQQTQLLFDRLTPGRLYQVSARSVLRGVRSIWSPPYDLRMKPAAVRNLRAARTTTNSIVLSIVPGVGTYSDFLITISNPADPRNNGKQYETDKRRLTIPNLLPGQRYTFSIVARSGEKSSRRIARSFQTTESTPPSPVATPETPPIAPFRPKCAINSRKLDLTFILSTSQGVSTTGYNQMKRFINRIVNGITIGNQDTLVSVIEFDINANTRFAFQANLNKASLTRAMNQLRRRGTASQNNLGRALNLYNNLVSSSQARTDAQKMVFILLNKPPSDQPNAIARRLRGSNVINAIAVGNRVPARILNQLASDPARTVRSRIYATLSNAEFLKDVIADIQCRYDQIPPQRPVGLQITNVTWNSFFVKWQGNQRYDRYGLRVRYLGKPSNPSPPADAYNLDLDKPEKLVESLYPGSLYRVTAVNRRGTTVSSPVSRQETVYPFALGLQPLEVRQTAIKMSYFSIRGNVEQYVLTIAKADKPDTNIYQHLRDASENSATFEPLEKNTLYAITAVAKSGERIGEERTVYIRTLQDDITLNIPEILQWESGNIIQRGDYEYKVVVTPVTVGLNMTERPDDGSIYYEIQLTTRDGQILTSTFIPPGGSFQTLPRLTPGTSYSLRIKPITANEISTPSTLDFRTLDLPRPVNVTVETKPDGSIIMSWDSRYGTAFSCEIYPAGSTGEESLIARLGNLKTPKCELPYPGVGSYRVEMRNERDSTVSDVTSRRVESREPAVPLPLQDISFTNLDNGDVLVKFDHAYEDLETALKFMFSFFVYDQPDNVVVRYQAHVVNGTVNPQFLLQTLEQQTTYGVDVFANTTIGVSGKQRYQFKTGIRKAPPANPRYDFFTPNVLTVTWDREQIATNYTCQLRMVDPTGKSPPRLISSNNAQSTPECEFPVTPGMKYIVSITNIFGDERSRTVEKEMNNPPLPLTGIVPLNIGEESIAFGFQPQAGTRFDSVDITIAHVDTPGDIIGNLTRKLENNSIDQRAEFDGLAPEQRYVITGIVKSLGMESTSFVMNITTRPKNVPPRNVKHQFSSPNTLTVTWDKPSGAERFTCQILLIDPTGNEQPSQKPSRYTANDALCQFQIIPGYKYNVTIMNIFGNVQSDPVFVQVPIPPLPLTGFNVANVGPDSLTFRFQWSDRTIFDYVTLQIARADNPEVVLDTAERRVVDRKIDNTVTFRGLSLSTSYVVTGVVRHGELQSTATTQIAQTVSTPESPPSPTGISQEFEAPNTLSVKWSRPEGANRFQCRLEVIETPGIPISGQLPTNYITDDASCRFGVIPGDKYNVTISNYIGNRQSDPVSIVVPVAPLPLTSLDVQAVAPDSMTLEFTWHNRTRFDVVTLQIARADNPEVVIDRAERRIVDNSITNTVTFRGLDAATDYVVSGVVNHGELESTPTIRRVTTADLPGKHLISANITSKFEAPSTLSVTWNRPEGATQFICQSQEINPVENTANPGRLARYGTTDASCRFSVVPGHRYNVTVTNIFGTFRSPPVSVQIPIAPMPLTGLNVIKSEPDSLTWRFEWHGGTRFDHVVFQLTGDDDPGVVVGTAERRIVNNGIDNTVTFDGLNPSTDYTVTGIVRHGDLESTPTAKTARTANEPDAPANITHYIEGPRTLRVRWNRPEGATSFTCQLQAPQLSQQIGRYRSSDAQCQFEITHGYMFNVTITNNFGALSSNPVSIEIPIPPVPLASVNLVDTGTNYLSVRFMWAERSRFDQIVIQIARANEPEVIIDTAERGIVNNKIDNTVTFRGLDPSTKYVVTGVVRHGELESTPTNLTAETDPDQRPPQDVKYVFRPPDKLVVTWTRPSGASNFLCRLLVDESGGPNPVARYSNNSSTDPNCEFPVIPGETYIVNIANIYDGQQVGISSRLPIPPLPLVRIDQVDKNEGSITVRFQHPIPSVFDAVELSIASADSPDDVIEVITTRTGNLEIDPNITFTGLKPGSNYIVTGVVKNGAATSNPIKQIVQTDLSDSRISLPPVENLRVEEVTGDSLVVRWDPHPDVEKYGAKIIEVVNGMPVQLYANDNLSQPEVHMLNGIVPGGMYQITGQNWVTGYHRPSEARIGIILQPPPPPEMKIETVGSHYSVIQYIPVAPGQGIVDATIFEIYASENMDIPFDSVERKAWYVGPNTIEFFGLKSNALYKIVAYNIRGGMQSAQGSVEFTTVVGDVSEKAYIDDANNTWNISLNASDVEATIQYSNDVQGVDYYDIHVTPLSGESAKLGETRLQVVEENQVFKHTVKSLKPDTRYQFVIVPHDDDAATQAKPVVSVFQTQPTSQLEPPKDVRILSVTANSFVVGWSNVPDAKHYRVEVHRLGNPLSPLESPEIVYNKTHPNNNDVEIDGLDPGTLYQITVTSIAADGNTKSRSAVEITEPEPMNINVVRVGSTDIDVEMKPGDGHTQYIVLFISPEIPLRVIKPAPSEEMIKLNIDGLEPDTNYTLRAYGQSGNRVGRRRDIPVETAPSEELLPGEIRTDATSISALLTYGIENPTEETNYTIFITGPDGVKTYYGRTIIGRIIYVTRIGNLIPSHRYNVTINVGGVEYFSQFETKSLPPPANIRFLDVTTNSFTIEWDEYPGAQEYSATITDGDNVFFNQSTSPTLTFKGLVPGQRYRVNVSNFADGVSSRNIPTAVTLVPKKVIAMRAMSTNYSRVVIAFFRSFYDGVQDGYNAVIKLKSSGEIIKEVEIPSGVNQFEFRGLLPQTEYEVVMWPVSGLQKGENTSIAMTTSSLDPRNIYVDPRPTSASIWFNTEHIDGLKYFIVQVRAHSVVNNQSTTVAYNIDQTRYTVETDNNLIPGTLYHVILTLTGDMKTRTYSNTFNTNQLPDPTGAKVINVTTDRFTVVWDEAKYVKEYQVNVTDAADGSLLYSGSSDKPNFVISDGVIPGRRYFMSIANLANRAWSRFVKLRDTVYPKDIKSLYVEESTATSVLLFIDRVYGMADEFVVTVTAKDDPNNVQSKRVKYPGRRISFSGLSPNTSYIATVYASSGHRRSNKFTLTFTTERPSPEILQVFNVSTNAAHIRYSDEGSESQLGFVISSVRNLHPKYVTEINSGVERGIKSIFISGLYPGLEYEVDHYYIYPDGISANLTARFTTTEGQGDGKKYDIPDNMTKFYPLCATNRTALLIMFMISTHDSVSYKQFLIARTFTRDVMDRVKVNGKRYALASIVEISDTANITLSPNQYGQTRPRLRRAINNVMRTTMGTRNNIGLGLEFAQSQSGVNYGMKNPQKLLYVITPGIVTDEIQSVYRDLINAGVVVRFIVIGECGNQELESVRENNNTVCLHSYAHLRRIVSNVSRDIECRFETLEFIQVLPTPTSAVIRFNLPGEFGVRRYSYIIHEVDGNDKNFTGGQVNRNTNTDVQTIRTENSLKPRTRYLLTIRPMRDNRGSPNEASHSKEFMTLDLPKPKNLTVVEITTRTIVVKWTPEPYAESYRMALIYRYRPSSPQLALDLNFESSTNDTHPMFQSSNNIPGSLYMIRAWNVAKGVFSEVEEMAVVFDPIAVRNLEVTDTTKDSISLRFSRTGSSDDGINDYFLAVLQEAGDSRVIQTRNISWRDREFGFNDLNYNTTYQVTVWTVSGEKRSPNVSITAKTDQLNPGDILVDATPGSANVTVSTGSLLGVKSITLTIHRNDTGETFVRDYKDGEHIYTFFVGNLEPSTIYYIKYNVIGKQNMTYERVFTTSGKDLISFNNIRKGENFLTVQANTSDTSNDFILFRIEHPDGSINQISVNTVESVFSYEATFGGLAPMTAYLLEAYPVLENLRSGKIEAINAITGPALISEIILTPSNESIEIAFDSRPEVDSVNVWIGDAFDLTILNETTDVTPGERFQKIYGPLLGVQNFTAIITPIVDGVKGEGRRKNFTTAKNGMTIRDYTTAITPAVNATTGYLGSEGFTKWLIDVELAPGPEDVTVTVDPKPDVEKIRVLIKDPAGEAVWNETEDIESGETFNKTYGLLDPFENYTAVIVPVVDGEDQNPVEENFTTVGKELTSVKVTDEGEDFLNVEAVSSDDSIDGVLFKLTHPNGSSEEILVESPTENGTYQASFDGLEPLTGYAIEAHPVVDGVQVGPTEKVTETTDPPLVTGLSVTPSDDSVAVEADPAEEVDSIRVLIKDDNGTTVVNETVPVRPGEKLDESFGPLEPSSDYTATITPISNGTEGKPREEEFRTDPPSLIDVELAPGPEDVTVTVDPKPDVEKIR